MPRIRTIAAMAANVQEMIRKTVRRVGMRRCGRGAGSGAGDGGAGGSEGGGGVVGMSVIADFDGSDCNGDAAEPAPV